MQRSETQQFLYEIPADTDVGETLQRVVKIHNLRLRIQRIKLEGEKLAVHAQGDEPTSSNDVNDGEMGQI